MFRHFVSVELKAKNSAIEMHRTHYPNVLKDKALWTKFVEWLRTKCVSEASVATEKKPDGASEASAAGKISSGSGSGSGESKLSSNKDVANYIEANGGVEKAVKSKTAWQFKQDVVAWLRQQPDFKKMGSMAKRGRIMRAELHAQTAYAKAFGITGEFQMKMGELIDPKTGKPVERGTDAGKVSSAGVPSKEASTDKGPLTNSSGDKVSDAVIKHYGAETLAKKPWLKDVDFPGDPDEEREAKRNYDLKQKATLHGSNDAKSAAKAVTATAATAGGAAAAGKIATDKPSDGKLTSNEWISRYIEENGGVDNAVKSKSAYKFTQDVVAWMRKQPEIKKMSTLRRRGQIMRAEMHARVAYAKAFGVTGNFQMRMGEVIDPKTGEPVKRDTPSASIKKADVAPTSSDKPTTQQEVNDAKSAAKSAQQASQIGPTVEAAKREEARAAREDKLLSTLESYTSVFGQFSRIIGKDGLQVAGIDTLTAVTAAKPVGGGTQIINNNTVVREANEGLDLRKKQW
jgi:hypothetical protein